MMSCQHGSPDTSGHDYVIKRWLIISKPHEHPRKVGEFPTEDKLISTLREAIAYMAFDTRIAVVRLARDLNIWVDDGREYLAIADTFAGRRFPPLRRALTSIQRRGGERTAAKLAGRKVRIWSGEHSAYWRRNGCGYTDGREEAAWVLPFEEAFARTRHCGPEKRIAYEAVL